MSTSVPVAPVSPSKDRKVHRVHQPHPEIEGQCIFQPRKARGILVGKHQMHGVAGGLQFGSRDYPRRGRDRLGTDALDTGRACRGHGEGRDTGTQRSPQRFNETT